MIIVSLRSQWYLCNWPKFKCCSHVLCVIMINEKKQVILYSVHLIPIFFIWTFTHIDKTYSSNKKSLITILTSLQIISLCVETLCSKLNEWPPLIQPLQTIIISIFTTNNTNYLPTANALSHIRPDLMSSKSDLNYLRCEAYK